MARLSINDVLGEDDGDEGPVGPAPPPPAPARELRGGGKGAARSRARKPVEPAPAPAAKGPKWEDLETKEARLWPDQVSALTDMRRDLQRRKRARGGGGERITENTLIRVAVAVLLENRDALSGVDEDELLESYRSALQGSGTPGVQDS